MWKNVEEGIMPQITIWHMLFACWVPKATNPLSEYALCIVFPLI